jgi:hypothetical protein
MTNKTRYVAISSLLVMTVGVGTGLVAYYAGFPAVLAGQGGRDDLKLLPANASLVAYANVRDIMSSEVRQRIRSLAPMNADGQREFEEQTGINIETDIDTVVMAVAPPDASSGGVPGAALVVVRGRFNDVKIESFMREHGATIETYKNKRMLLGRGSQPNAPSMSLAFLEPGAIAVGTSDVVRHAVDLAAGSAGNVTTNPELMGLVGELEAGNAWAVGRFDVLTSQANLPAVMSQRLPAITWFSASARIDSGISGVLRADARDDQAAESLRDVVRGIVALGKLQASSSPDVQSALSGLRLGGTGKTVSLAFDLPAASLDALGSLALPGARP